VVHKCLCVLCNYGTVTDDVSVINIILYYVYIPITLILWTIFMLHILVLFGL